MAKPFETLRTDITPERRAKVDAATKALLASMPMHQLRRARALSQEQLADTLNIKQASVSKLERRTDLYISTLRRYIEAMGGALEIRANFPEGSIEITHLGDTDDSDEHSSASSD